jgi:serine/threonine protein kinase
MAPEQLRGQPADERSDVWALGVVLYEMAAGARPFRGRTPFELTSGIFHGSFPPLPSRMPPPFHAVTSRCLEKEPARRYQRASEVQAALETLGGSGITAIKPWPMSTLPRSWILTAAAVVAAVTVLAGGVSLIPWFR